MKGKRVKRALYSLSFLVVLSACANPVASKIPVQKENPLVKRQAAAAELDTRAVKASNAFGLQLHRKLTEKTQNKENVFISPISVSQALSMTYNGSKGETRQAMAKTLGLEGMTPDEVNRANKTMLSLLAAPGGGIQLNIANSLWTRKGVPFNEDFLAANKTNYQAEVNALDFSDPKAPATINDWVKSKTQGKIPTIIKQISADDVLFLVNAVYFKGGWQKVFDPASTREENFKLLDGSSKKVQMMSQGGSYEYLKLDGVQAIRLPYGDGQMAMLVLLPDESSSLAALQEKLWADPSRWQKGFVNASGEVRLPRFKIEYEAELGESLAAMGMGVAFDRNKADFSGMAPVPPNLFISYVKHKTFVEVNEKGTEAAASTVVAMTAGSAPNTERFQMTVDRPFFFAIEDRQTGAWLFTGSIVEP